MKDKIYNAFHEIKAEDKLKQDTLAFLQEKMSEKRKSKSKRITIAFTSVFLFFLLGLSYNLYFSASAYVDIDVNPSIELILNRYNRVIDVYAYNEDGAKVISAVSLKHKSYDEAIRILIDEMSNEGYIKDDGLFSATLQTKDDKNDVLLNTLKTIVNSSLSSHHNTLVQDVFMVDSKTKTYAHDLHLSPAKYLAIKELQAVDDTVTFDSCKNHTISEIKEQTHNHINNRNNESDGNHESSNENSSNEEHHNGHKNNVN